MMRKGDVVYYVGKRKECHNIKYEVVNIHKNGFGINWWYDLKAVEENADDMLSVERVDIEEIQE
jgi:hypothetical protein